MIPTHKLYYHRIIIIILYFIYNNFKQNCTIIIKMYVYCKLCIAVCFSEILVETSRGWRKSRNMKELSIRKNTNIVELCILFGVTEVLIHQNARSKQCKSLIILSTGEILKLFASAYVRRITQLY
jgi:hypothetical protein